MSDYLAELAALLVTTTGLICMSRTNVVFPVRNARLLIVGFWISTAGLVVSILGKTGGGSLFLCNIGFYAYVLGAAVIAIGFAGWSLAHAKVIDDLRRVALLDELTGLYNRRGFVQRFEEEIDRSKRHGRRLGILMIDLDNFKAINDKYGHIRGDKFLVETAEVLRHEVRASDIVARIGGDEFACILVEVSPADVQMAVDRIKATFVEISKTILKSVESPVGISIGMAVFPEDGSNISELISVADMRMYSDKKSSQKPWRFPLTGLFIRGETNRNCADNR